MVAQKKQYETMMEQQQQQFQSMLDAVMKEINSNEEHIGSHNSEAQK